MKILENKKKFNKSVLFSFRLLLILLVVILYILYLIYVLKVGTGPIDYETFMQIGTRLVEGKKIYGENSYYPMPYVGIFAIFSQLPFSISFLTWVVVPVICAIIISGWSPVILLFGPLFGHFVGGQTSIFGMIGFWGYRKNQTSKWAGIWLSLLLLKPQLAIAPLGWAGYNWIRQYISEKRISDQFTIFFISTLLIFLPWFFFNPEWVNEWLANPRNIRLRGMASIVPRTFSYFNLHPIIFWLFLILITICLIYWLFKKNCLILI